MKEITFEDIKKAYLITSDGKIINKTTNREKKPFVSNSGYKRVTLWFDGKQKKMSVHRLVAMMYIPNPNNLSQVNHIDGDKKNNNVNNLEWCDQRHNTKEAYKLKLINPKTTKVNQYDLKGNFIKTWDSIKEVCEKLKLNHGNICTICGGKTDRKQTGGYIWKYKEENNYGKQKNNF